MVQMLRGGALGTDRATRALGVIERNARTQAQLIGDLLDLSRIITGNLRLHFRPVQLAQIVNAAIDVIHPAADNKGISIDVSLDASISLVGDAERLQQIMWNLLCPDLHDVRVLVVDDDPDARELLLVMLEQCRATVSLASSAAEGLALLQRGRHDLLIADIGMPGQDGYDLIRAVRGQSPAPGRRVPAIAVTAYAGDKDQEEALAAGYDAHVPKPVEADRFYSVIANLLSRTTASR